MMRQGKLLHSKSICFMMHAIILQNSIQIIKHGVQKINELKNKVSFAGLLNWTK